MREMIARPHPRALFYEIDQEVFGALDDLFPTSREIDSMAEVNFGDWDLLVTGGPVPSHVDPELFVVSFGEGALGSSAASRNEVFRGAFARKIAISVAAQLLVSEDLPAPIAGLVPRLLAATDMDEPHSCLLAGSALVAHFGGAMDGVDSAEIIRPIVMTSDGYPVAGWWQRAGSGWAMSLPDYLTHADQVDWVRAAVSVWAGIDPVRFPAEGDEWSRHPSWMTADELVALEGVRSARDYRAAEITRLDDQLAADEAELAALRVAGDAGARLLLTGTGDPLVSEVARTLRLFGFSVREMDAEWPDNDRREDLRITDDENPDWLAIGEVKGFGRSGPKAGDLITLIGRFRKRFVQDEQREPTALWYIVNQRSLTPPDARPRGAGVERGDLEAFRDEGGLIIDTIDLFALARAVARGERELPAIRAQLRGASGLFATE